MLRNCAILLRFEETLPDEFNNKEKESPLKREKILWQKPRRRISTKKTTHLDKN